MSPIEHVWDALDRHIRQRVPVPANIQQLCTAIEEEWTNIPQATINNLINSMRRRWQMVVTPDTDCFFFLINKRVNKWGESILYELLLHLLIYFLIYTFL